MTGILQGRIRGGPGSLLFCYCSLGKWQSPSERLRQQVSTGLEPGLLPSNSLEASEVVAEAGVVPSSQAMDRRRTQCRPRRPLREVARPTPETAQRRRQTRDRQPPAGRQVDAPK